MKKIVVFTAAVLLCAGPLFAQKEKAVAEKEVKVSFVKDFQRQVKDATAVQWYQIDEQTFKVTYRDGEGSRQAMVFSNKGMETHYIIESKYMPLSVKEYVSANYPKFKITELWVRRVRNKMTYQTRISRTSGFLWWKKEKEVKILNFEVDGTFISTE